MLYGLAYLTQHKDELKEVIKNKHIALDFEAFFSMVEKRNKLLATLEELRAKRNEISHIIEKGDKSLIDNAKEIKVKIQEAEEEYKKQMMFAKSNHILCQTFTIPQLQSVQTIAETRRSRIGESQHSLNLHPRAMLNLARIWICSILRPGRKLLGLEVTI